MISWGFMKYKADAETCYREIQSLGEEVTPQMIVDFARDEDTELHKCFQWDDSVAAENWRKQQARQVVMSHTVKVERSEHGEAQTGTVDDRVVDGPVQVDGLRVLHVLGHYSAGTSCLTRSCSSARFASLNRSSVPTR